MTIIGWRWVLVYAIIFGITLASAMGNVSCMMLNNEKQMITESIKELSEIHRELTLQLWDKKQLSKLNEIAKKAGYGPPRRINYIQANE